MFCPLQRMQLKQRQQDDILLQKMQKSFLVPKWFMSEIWVLKIKQYRTIFQLEFGITTELRWTTRNGIETGLAWRQSPRSFTFCGFAAPRRLRFKVNLQGWTFHENSWISRKSCQASFAEKQFSLDFLGGNFQQFLRNNFSVVFCWTKKIPSELWVSPAPQILRGPVPQHVVKRIVDFATMNPTYKAAGLQVAPSWDDL